jgi:lysophospholipase L1-like esterase
VILLAQYNAFVRIEVADMFGFNVYSRVPVLTFALSMLVIAWGIAFQGVAAEMSVENESKDTVVIIGASYARGWNPDNLWGADVINKGVNGEETHQMLARFDDDVLAIEPRAVIIWGFINDIFRGDLSQMEEKLSQSRENLVTMLDQATDHSIVPVVATEVTITNPDTFTEWAMSVVGKLLGKVSYQDTVNRHVTETNDWLREEAKRRGLLVLDFEKALADSDGRRKRVYASPDGSHITAAGYETLTNYVRDLNLQPTPLDR